MRFEFVREQCSRRSRLCGPLVVVEVVEEPGSVVLVDEGVGGEEAVDSVHHLRLARVEWGLARVEWGNGIRY